MIGSQTPRISSVPLHDPTVGDDAVRWCAEHKINLDPWQQLVLRSSLGTKPDGKFAAFEVGLCVARQNGKGEVLMARELYGVLELGERLIIHSAHDFATSSEHFLRLEHQLEESGLQDELKTDRGRLTGIKRSHGEEGFEFKNRGRIRFRTRTKGGGKGFTGDVVVLDEAMFLQQMFHGALLPVVSARSQHGNPQVWYAGSSVDQMIHEHGLVFSRVRERGMAHDPDLAYFEWSIDGPSPEETSLEVLEDPAQWSLANPGMGIRISEEHIAKEFRSLDKRMFAVERGGVGDWPRTDGLDAVFDLDLWARLANGTSEPVGPVGYSFDVRPDRSRAVIALVGRNAAGRLHWEIGETQEGTGWLVPRLEELDRKAPLGIVCDGVGPASSIVPELKQRNVDVKVLTTPEVAEACGMTYDAVMQENVAHLDDDRLLHAIKGAVQRPLGDRWAWNRRNSTSDISPLVACTLGTWLVVTSEAQAPMFAFG